MSNEQRSRRLAMTLALALAALAGGGGFLLGLGVDHVARAAAASPYRKLQVFTKVLSFIERNYVEQVDEQKLVYGAIRGMIDTLDPHSLFMPPDVYREMKQGAIGEFGGVGLEIGVRDGRIVVITPLDGTPAQRAGFLPGDLVLSIDGVSTDGMTLSDVVTHIRGDAGTTVRFEVRRAAAKDPIPIELKREQLHIVPVEGKVLLSDLMYLRIKSFQKNTFSMLAETIERLQAEAGGSGKIKGCILDLRNNPGGLVEQAIKVADEFLDEGLIVSTEGREKRDSEKHYAQHGGRLDWPLVVLVNRGSASASEIVAGALQDHGRAVILGSRTFGKGSVQTVIDLDDGAGLKLTVARYYTPSHRSIQGHGIDPDITVEPLDLVDLRAKGLLSDEEGGRESDMAGHLQGEPGATLDPRSTLPEAVQRDNQLKSALDYLRAVEILGKKK